MNPAFGYLPIPRDVLLRLIVCIIGMLIVTAICIYSHFHSHLKSPEKGHGYRDSRPQSRWPDHAVIAAVFFLIAAFGWHSARYRFALVLAIWVLWVCGGLVQVVLMVRSIRQHRSQWSIRTLLLITLIVAVACSLLTWQGWRMVPILIGVLLGAMLLRSAAPQLKSWRQKPHD